VQHVQQVQQHRKHRHTFVADVLRMLAGHVQHGRRRTPDNSQKQMNGSKWMRL
jgi:hypothetical protein